MTNQQPDELTSSQRSAHSPVIYRRRVIERQEETAGAVPCHLASCNDRNLRRRRIAVGFRVGVKPPVPVVFWELDTGLAPQLHRITRIRRDWWDEWHNHCYEVDADNRVYYLIRHRALEVGRYHRRHYWLLALEPAPPSLPYQVKPTKP
ncbi:MAG: hypothetical protein IMX01_00780 [Limnochordaceae bacterium]|nr:hypothetical protein [Limnochordaceae bacterium]